MTYTLRKVKAEDYDSPMGGPYRQTVRFALEELPETAFWQVGEEYEIVVKVKMTGDKRELEDGEVEEEGKFEIMAVGALDDSRYDAILEKLGVKKD